MRKNLKMLDELQEIDLKIDGFKGEKDALLEELASLDGKVAAAEAGIAEKSNELALFEEERLALDENLAAETENISRSETRLKEIKTQKEYQAVSKEINTARKLKVELEEQALQKIGRIEELKAEIAGQAENLTALNANIAAQKGEVQAKIDQLEEGIGKDVAAREELVKALPSTMIRRYTLLREQRRGIAVVEAKAGSCLGCNMNLTPQLYNTLFRGDELITCPHCQRILVLRQEG
ncbi:MAG TPA: C4-type zinc ribbon domain-containing protein [Geobacteraceae bacterium]|nr:C4-type zinc ribbon domain-containing protein [Geobacteraceae bacterium]